MTGIIILNWNGWEDTIECLKSLFKIVDTNFFIVIADNGSSNDSVSKISNFLENSESDFIKIIENKEDLPSHVNNKTCILYELNENYGFAKGNNKALNIAKRFSPEFFILLNNDTIVEKDFLSQLIKFQNNNPVFEILTPRISYYFNKDIIWNCGGALNFGFRKYYYADKSISTIKEKEYIKIGYITGCALFFKANLIKDKPLLTEKFFHGEEDFEFSYRMRRCGIKIACVLSSHIYHKVGMSLSYSGSIGKMYIHYLNRFIDMRQQMSQYAFILWKSIYFPYIFLLLKKHAVGNNSIFKFLKRLNNESKNLDEVTKEKFFSELSNWENPNK